MKIVWIVLLALVAALVLFFGLWLIAVPLLHSGVVSRLDLEPGMRVADVGCGPGLVTVPLARGVVPGGVVVAYDVKPRMMKWTANCARKSGISNVRAVAAGAGDGKMERGYFDRAVLITVLGEMADPAAALADIFQALKPSGILSVTESRPDPHFHNQAEVRRLVEAAGFRQQAVFGNGIAFTANFVKPNWQAILRGDPMTVSVCPIATVAAPVSIVWAVLSDPASYDDWWDAQAERIEPAGRATPGQVIHATARGFGRSWPVTTRVVAVDAARHALDLKTELPLGIVANNHILCAPLDASTTRVTFG